MLRRFAAAIGGGRYIAVIAVASAAMAYALAPSEFDSWRGWWVSVGGVTQLLGPIVAGFSVIVGSRATTGDLGAAHASASQPAGIRRLAQFSLIYLLTLAGYLASIFIVAGYALAARQPWGFTLSWWLLLPPAALPVMIIGGLLIGEKIRRRWVAIPVAFATYVLLAIPLYLQGALPRLSPVQQLLVDPWALETSADPFLIGVWVLASAVIVAVASLNLRSRRALAVIAVLSITASITTATAAKHTEHTPYFAWQSPDAVVECRPAEATAAELCMHPAYSSIEGEVLELSRTIVPRMRQLGIEVQQLRQVSSFRQQTGPATTPFVLFSASPRSIQLGLQEGFRYMYYTRCRDRDPVTAEPISRLFSEWLLGFWPQGRIDDTWPGEIQRDLERLAKAKVDDQASWLQSHLTAAGCNFNR